MSRVRTAVHRGGCRHESRHFTEDTSPNRHRADRAAVGPGDTRTGYFTLLSDTTSQNGGGSGTGDGRTGPCVQDAGSTTGPAGRSGGGPEPTDDCPRFTTEAVTEMNLDDAKS